MSVPGAAATGSDCAICPPAATGGTDLTPYPGVPSFVFISSGGGNPVLAGSLNAHHISGLPTASFERPLLNHDPPRDHLLPQIK